MTRAAVIPPLLLVVASWGCASGGRKAEPAQTAEEFIAAHAPEVEPPPATPAEPPEAPPGTVVIDEPEGGADGAPSLLEAARAERERRRTQPPPAIVITDENLAEYATGELTLVSGTVSAENADAPRPDAGGLEGADDEESYWRSRIRQARQDLSSTREEIRHLEERVAELRRRFYEEDDPYYRDAQIKPAWDRSLERLAEARAAAEEFAIRIDEILEEGRQAGALPGWLREGLELVPPEDGDSEARLPEHEPREPTTVEVEEPDGR